jgi:hypothetical protein
MQLPPMPNESVHRTIAVDYSESEYIEFNLVMFRDRIRVQIIALVGLAAALVVVTLFMPSGLEIPAPPAALFCAAVMLIWAVTYKESVKHNVRQLYRSTSNLPAIKRTTTLDRAGVKQDGHDGSGSFIPWTSIVEVREGHLAIYLIQNSQIGTIVPKRGFPSSEDAEAFATFAREQLRLSRLDRGFE